MRDHERRNHDILSLFDSDIGQDMNAYEKIEIFNTIWQYDHDEEDGNGYDKIMATS